MKKLFSAAILLLFFAWSPAASENRQEILVWGFGLEGTLLRPMARAFEEENPEIKVVTQAIPWGLAHEKLLTAVVGRVPPDVAQMGTTWVPEFQSMNAFQELDSYLDESFLEPDDFLESSFAIGRINDNIYSIPWYVETRVLYYRTDMLQEVGYAHPPRTWEELLDAAVKLARRSGNYGIALPVTDWQSFLPFLWQNEGSVLDPESGNIKVTQEEFAQAIEYYGRFFNEGAAPLEDPEQDLMWAFKEGYYPMFISGPWMINEIGRLIPEIDGKWEVAMLPGNKNRTSFVGGSHLTLFKDSPNKDAAWKFIEYMSRPENQIKWYEISGGLPASAAVWEDGYFRDDPKIRVFGEQLLHSRGQPVVPEWEEIASRIGRRLEQIFIGGREVRTAQKDLKKDIENIIARREDMRESNLIFWMAAVSTLAFIIFFLYFRGGIKQKHMISGREEKKEKIEVPGGMLGMGFKKTYIPYLFIIPSILTLILFLFIPIFSSFLISLTNWNVYTFAQVSLLEFVGLNNYIELFSDDVFWHSLRNTFVFAFVGIPFNISLAMFVAVMIDKKYIKVKGLFRSGYFMPVITTLVAVAVVWRWLYNPEFGLINYLISLAGIEPQRWLSDTRLALPALIVMSVWRNFGYNMVIILAGLQTIPSTLYEAAEVDGANAWQQFWNVTLPSLKSTLFFVVVITTIGAFQFFEEPYIMTDGGPLNSTISMVMNMYQQGFEYFRFGYGSAIGFILFLCILSFTLIQIHFRKKWEAD